MMDDLHNLNANLKQSAEEFALVPSQNVWANVEKEISKRRRKRGIFFLLAGTLCVGGAVAWFWTNPDDKFIAEQQGQQTAAGTDIPALTDENKGAHVINAEPLWNNRASNHAVSPVIAPAEPENNRDVGNVNARDDRSRDAGNLQNMNSPGQGEHDVHMTDATTQGPVIPDQDSQEPQPGLNPETPTKEELLHQDDSSRAEQSQSGVHPSVNELTHVDTVVPPPATEVQSLVIQDSIPSEPGKRFMIGLGVRPAISFTRFKEDGDYHFIADYRDSTERGVPVWNLQLDFGYMFRNTYLYSGLHLVNYKTEMPNQQVVYHYDQGPISGPAPPPVVVSRDYFVIDNNANGMQVNKLTYLGIPIGARIRTFERNKFSVWLQAEFTTHYQIGLNNYVYDDNTQQYRKGVRTDMRAWNYSVSAAIHLQYAFDDRFALAVSPGIEGFGNIYDRNYMLSQRFNLLYVQGSFHYSF